MQMDVCLERWVHEFEKLEIPALSDYGLHGGNTGLAVCYHVLHRCTQQRLFFEKAAGLLDAVGEHIMEMDTTGFADGLAGVGWAVEWLVRNKYIAANTDDVLGDLDDEMYKSVIYTRNTSISLNTGSLGKALYFLSRQSSVNPGTHRFKTLCHQECLAILLSTIVAGLPDARQIKEGNRNLVEGILDISNALVFYGKVWKAGDQDSVMVEDALYQAAKVAEDILEHWYPGVNAPLTDKRLPGALLQLAYSRYFAGRAFHCSYWMQQGEKHVREMLSSIKAQQQPLPALPHYLALMGRLYRENMMSAADFFDACCRVMAGIDFSGRPALCGRMLMPVVYLLNDTAGDWDECYLLS